MMLKFIALCMGIVAFAFFAMPIFFNVTEERAVIIQAAENNQNTIHPSEEDLIAVTVQESEENSEFGAFLNDIAPASGAENAENSNDFGQAFGQKPHPAL